MSDAISECLEDFESAKRVEIRIIPIIVTDANKHEEKSSGNGVSDAISECLEDFESARKAPIMPKA